jgi:SOS regulatory protein LexA
MHVSDRAEEFFWPFCPPFCRIAWRCRRHCHAHGAHCSTPRGTPTGIRAILLLKVRGMSMKDAGILDGDLLAVHRSAEAKAGQVVVARIGDEVTVKRFQRRGHTVQLLPENPDFEPIVVDLKRQELVIEGIAVGVIRSGKT